MADRFVFTITTGRSGTAWFAELLQRNLDDAAVFHERTGFTNFGLVTPDLSDFTLFNSVGNVSKVQAFWKRKLERDRAGPCRIHAEASHLLAKAGLLENLGVLTGAGATVEIVVLRRDVLQTLWSFYNRFDFVNKGLAWAFYLDLDYPNVIVDPAPFRSHGAVGRALWYIVEMRVRGSYYRQIMAEEQGVRFHVADLEAIRDPAGAQALFDAMGLSPAEPVTCPPPRNESADTFFPDEDREKLAFLLSHTSFDEDALARRFVASGRRLADGRQASDG